MEMQVQEAAEKILGSQDKSRFSDCVRVKGKFTNTGPGLKTGHYNYQETKRPPRKAAATNAKIESLRILL
jgi:hypothetical protein